MVMSLYLGDTLTVLYALLVIRAKANVMQQPVLCSLRLGCDSHSSGRFPRSIRQGGSPAQFDCRLDVTAGKSLLQHVEPSTIFVLPY
jgi:hypothetical protein